MPEADSDIEEADPTGEDEETFEPEDPEYPESSGTPNNSGQQQAQNVDETAADHLLLSTPSSSLNETSSTNATTSNDNQNHHYYLTMLKNFKNVSRETGDNVRLKCDFSGNPLPRVNWFKNEAPIEAEKGKVLIKWSRVREHADRVRARLIINKLDTHDTGYYKCQAVNGVSPPLEHLSTLVVRAGKQQQQQWNNSLFMPHFS